MENLSPFSTSMYDTVRSRIFFWCLMRLSLCGIRQRCNHCHSPVHLIIVVAKIVYVSVVKSHKLWSIWQFWNHQKYPRQRISWTHRSRYTSKTRNNNRKINEPIAFDLFQRNVIMSVVSVWLTRDGISSHYGPSAVHPN